MSDSCVVCELDGPQNPGKYRKFYGKPCCNRCYNMVSGVFNEGCIILHDLNIEVNPFFSKIVSIMTERKCLARNPKALVRRNKKTLYHIWSHNGKKYFKSKFCNAFLALLSENDDVLKKHLPKRPRLFRHVSIQLLSSDYDRDDSFTGRGMGMRRK